MTDEAQKAIESASSGAKVYLWDSSVDIIDKASHKRYTTRFYSNRNECPRCGSNFILGSTALTGNANTTWICENVPCLTFKWAPISMRYVNKVPAISSDVSDKRYEENDDDIVLDFDDDDDIILDFDDEEPHEFHIHQVFNDTNELAKRQFHSPQDNKKKEEQVNEYP
jgi:hypothetical protein